MKMIHENGAAGEFKQVFHVGIIRLKITKICPNVGVGMSRVQKGKVPVFA